MIHLSLWNEMSGTNIIEKNRANVGDVPDNIKDVALNLASRVSQAVKGIVRGILQDSILNRYLNV